MLTRRVKIESSFKVDENAKPTKSILGGYNRICQNSRPRGVFKPRENLESVNETNFKKPELPNKIVCPDSTSAKEKSPQRCEEEGGRIQTDQLNAYSDFLRQRKEIREKNLYSKNALDFKQLDHDIDHVETSVIAFAERIFNYLQNKEFICQPISPSFLNSCDDITPRMRYILVNWLVQVHQGYKLQPETLYLCVAIMDRYLQKVGNFIRKDTFQLVGVTALFIASKFEETYPPEIGDFASITDNTFTKRDIIKCEQHILQSLDFYLSVPSPLMFLRRISRIMRSDRQTHNLAKYFLELTIQESDLAHLPGNLRAAAAACLSSAVLANSDDFAMHWNDKMSYASGYYATDIRIPLRILAKVAFRQNSPSKYRAIHDKYRLDSLFDRVAALPQLRSTIMETLADLKFDVNEAEVLTVE